MINLPLTSKISAKAITELSANINSFTGGSIQTVEGVTPNLLSEKTVVEYPMLTINELASIEQVLDSSKGSERFSWNSKKWIVDEYTSSYYPQYALSVTLNLIG